MNEYTVITKNAILENTKIGFDLFLRTDVNGQPRYILFCCADEQFTPERRDELINRKDRNLYIFTKDIDKYLRYQEKNLADIIGDSSKNSHEKSGVLYQVAKNVISDLFESPGFTEHTERVSAWVRHTIKHIIENEDTFSSMMDVISRDYRMYTHSVNTSVIGLLFGKYLCLTQHELDSLGTGLLLHDLGKIKLPPELINKRSHLTREELSLICTHPKEGLGLLEHRESIDSTSLKAVIQHHENYDGTGYPYGIGGKDIHLFGQIARIVDVYDAMTSRRPYADAKRPFAALAQMKDEMSHCFDRELFIEFVCFLGLKDKRKTVRENDTLYSTPTNALKDSDRQPVLCAQGY